MAQEEITLSINENIENYESLVNKPKINSVELKGNKSLSDLGIQPALSVGENITINNDTISATDTTYTAGNNVSITNNVISATDTTYSALSEFTNDTGFITSAYHDNTKADASDVSAIDTRLTEAEEDITVLDTAMGLKADKTELPTKLSDLTNDEDFISETAIDSKDATTLASAENYADTGLSLKVDTTTYETRLATKLDKPATPTEKSFVTLDSLGVVGTSSVDDNWELINEFDNLTDETTTEPVQQVSFTVDKNGNAFSLKKMFIEFTANYNSSPVYKIYSYNSETEEYTYEDINNDLFFYITTSLGILFPNVQHGQYNANPTCYIERQKLASSYLYKFNVSQVIKGRNSQTNNNKSIETSYLHNLQYINKIGIEPIKGNLPTYYIRCAFKVYGVRA